MKAQNQLCKALLGLKFNFGLVCIDGEDEDQAFFC